MEGLFRTHLVHGGAGNHTAQRSFGQAKAALFIQTFKRYIAMQSKLVKWVLLCAHVLLAMHTFEIARRTLSSCSRAWWSRCTRWGRSSCGRTTRA